MRKRFFAMFVAASTVALTLNVQAAESIASYQKKFDQRMAKMKNTKSSWTEEEKATMARAEKMLTQDLPNPGIKVGTTAPDFSLKNAFGKSVSLSQSLKKGPAVIVFYRGAWCPYCNMHLRALEESAEAFAPYNAQVIAISPQNPDKAAEQMKKQGYAFEVVSDENNQVMKQYKLYFEPPKDLLALYKRKGLDLTEFNGDETIGLPTPGVFIVDQQGIVRAMQAQTDYKKRMEPKDIVKALAAL